MASATLAASDKEEAKVADQAEAKAFDRGVGKMNSVFIPKGYIGGGFTFSYKTYDLGKSADDVGYSMLFSLLSGINGDMHTLGISPSVSYFLLDNFSVGARFDYSRTNLNVGNLGLSLGDLASLSIQDYHMLKNMYSTAVTARYYMPIANSKRIAMFGEVRLGFDVGQSVSYQTKDGNNFGTFQSIYGGGLNVVPGLCVFATNEVCVEVAVGVLGINYQYVKQVTNLVDESARSSPCASGQPNLSANSRCSLSRMRIPRALTLSGSPNFALIASRTVVFSSLIVSFSVPSSRFQSLRTTRIPFSLALFAKSRQEST